MTDDVTIGQRVAFYRRRRGLSQEVLAGLVGKAQEWLRKVETNRADLDRLSVIRAIAKALDVSLGDLIGAPSLFEWSDDSGRETIPALRAALAALLDAEVIGPTKCAITSSPATSSGKSSPAPGRRNWLSSSANVWGSGREDRAGSWVK